MANGKKETDSKNLNSIDEQKAWISAALFSLTEAVATVEAANQEKVAQAFVEDSLERIKEQQEADTYARAEGLFAIALAHLSQLNSAPFREQLISDWFPNDRERLVGQLKVIQDEYGVGEKTIKRLVKAVENQDALNPEQVLASLNTIVKKLQRKPDRDFFKEVLNLVVLIWPDLSHEHRAQYQAVFTNLSIGLAKQDPIGTAELFIHWQDQLDLISRESDINRPELGLLHSTSTEAPTYSETLRQLIPVQAFDALGFALKHGAWRSATDIPTLFEKFDNILVAIQDYPHELIGHMIDVFVEAGFVRWYLNGNFRLTKKGMSAVNLGSSELENVQLATEFLSPKKVKLTESKDPLVQLEKTYEKHQLRVAIPEKQLSIDGDSRIVAYIGDVLFGQKDLRVESVTNLLSWIKALPEDEKPHQVVVSGIVAGGYHFRQKDKRAGLAETSMEKQFSYAKWFFDQLISMGLEVSYVLSSEDIEQARNYTLMAMRALQHWTNPQPDSTKGHITYWQEDQIKQSDAYDIHYDFQVNVALPYYLRSGRRLRSADEVLQMNIVREEYRHLSEQELRQTPGVYVRQEEYIILYDAYQRLLRGENLPLHYHDILEIDNIQLPGNEYDSLNIYNGLKLTTTLHNAGTVTDITSLLHHNGLEFSPTALKKMPLPELLALMGQMVASGKELPDEIVTFHQKQAMAIGGAVSTPGMDTVNLNQRSQELAIPGETSLRHIKRGTAVPNPGALTRRVYDDGRVVTQLLTQRQMELSNLGERTAIAFLSDAHLGSVAARPDLFINYGDYLMRKVTPNYPTVLGFMGDLIQGRNVPSMPEENALAGLPQLQQQEAMLHRILDQVFTQGRKITDLPPELQNIIHAYLVTGNHELNSGPKDSNHAYTLGTTEVLARILGDEKVEHLHSIVDPTGNIFHHPGGVTDRHGGVRTYLSHKFYWGKFGGGNPIVNAQKMTAGLGHLFNETDIVVQGDLHFSAFGFTGDKLALVVPSTCVGTGYEFGRGVFSQPGATILYAGGGKPLEIHELSYEFLLRHQITSGPLSEEALADSNPWLVSDKSFDPFEHGLYTGISQPHSALQRWVLFETEQIQKGNRSRMGGVINSRSS